ncbi:hypothetical protein NKR23_g4681 [Pleurostoma richardsiae]|uniref:Heterokaryon incompatibility domain-containing protein n=1 Tax=Pleurostoma richardsiae TaxID=41990 RepID=A0AA38VFN0_9PEZI|nr:hypothetical protein NKR23_g4681 [Pleurostoma richardsiae]
MDNTTYADRTASLYEADEGISLSLHPSPKEQPSTDPHPIKTVANDYSQYQPLNPDKQEIRVIILHPAEDPTSPIECSLVETSLVEDSPQYEALSYCWGDFGKTRTIRIRHLDGNIRLRRAGLSDNGITVPPRSKHSAWWFQREFHVTETLFTALVEFRLAHQVRYIWADAICINQGDVEERSQQVGFMRTVYETAVSVLVWLPGPESSEFNGIGFLGDLLTLTKIFACKAGLSLETLFLETCRSAEKLRSFWEDLFASTVASDADVAWDEDSILEWLLSGVPESDHIVPPQRRDDLNLHTPGARDFAIHFLQSVRRRAPAAIEMISDFWKLDSYLSENPWFWRVWVLQEVGSNENVTLCRGGEQVPWESIAAAEFFRYSFRAAVDFARNWSIPFAWFRVTSGRHRERMPLLDMIGLSSAFLATDPRDTLFAVLGLMIEFAPMTALPYSVAPDYSKTKRQVFTDFTSWVISHTKSLEILSFASHCYKRNDAHGLDLPTWVPDFSGQLPMLERTIGLYSRYTACGNSEVKRHPCEGADIICLEGRNVEVVSAVIAVDVRTDSDWDLVCLDEKGSETPAIPRLWQLLRSELLSMPGEPGMSSLLRADGQTHSAAFENFIRCLICATFTEGEYDGDKLIRKYQNVQDALESHLADWLEMDPDLGGFGPAEKDFVHRLGLQGQSQDRNIFRSVAGYSLLNRRFFVTSSGSFGLGFVGIEQGDLVVLLDGGPTPYILRQKSFPRQGEGPGEALGASTCEFMGECYLDGYMEALHGGGTEVEFRGCGQPDGQQAGPKQGHVFRII